ncbi:uncharacterized protein LOC114537119 [Dendronephthya gigantea]|uniref:uncharacterized protein LOC114537119 n=1 Tax=Dendronephthya gigantea TaxID=151771 RepID=UPI00106C1008|nr:uncharacterized protein LOC114537119 [Dendronephthya gigantea]
MKKAEISQRFHVYEILLILCAIQTTYATDGQTNMFMACADFARNTLSCNNRSIICIESIKIGQEPKFKCPRVENAKENENCTKEVVEDFVKNKCNGANDSCNVFYRDTEISSYCKRAFKYVEIFFACVSSPSKCSTIPPTSPTTTKASTSKRFPSVQHVMAQRIVSSTKIPPTTSPRTSPKNVEDQTSNSISLTDSPITIAQKPEPNTSRTRSGLPSPVQGIKMCTRKSSTNVATISSTKPGSNVDTTKPPDVKRSNGHCFLPWRFHLMVILVGLIAIRV